MKKNYLGLLIILINTFHAFAQSQGFTLESVQSYPFTTALTAAASGARIAGPLIWKASAMFLSRKGLTFSPINSHII